ncbi:MAG: FkbM family methyltransferase, partial [Dongiaceae bacterium]
MGSPQSSRSSKTPEANDDDTERGPLRGALRRLGLWSGENGGGQRQQVPIPPARMVRFEANAERHDLGFMQRYLRPGDAVLDIGAHAGPRAIPAARLVGPPGRVDAFEPSPTLRTALIDNIADANLRSVVVVHALMAGATAGLGRFVDGTSRS